MRTIDDFNFKEKKVLIRVDFNVPLEKGRVTDTTRIKSAVPTILKIIKDGGACILMSHLGRPNGFEDQFSLIQIKSELDKILKIETKFCTDCVGPIAEEMSQKLLMGEVLLLENLRFYSEETKGDEGFSKKLSQHASCYVNDAFGTAHRAHASTTVVAKYFENKFFGKLLEKEVLALKKVMNNGASPILAVLGGSKISSKIPIIENIIDKVDDIIIGGGMSFTFIKALGGKIGSSIHEDSMTEKALSILELAEQKNTKIHLPVDVVCAKEFKEGAESKIFAIDSIPDEYEGLDSGPKSLEKFKKIIMSSKTILWNGPVGVFELESFSKGTKEIGTAISESTKSGAFSLVGGGDSVAAVKKFKLENEVSYVSTGGGAMLESLEGKILPGISALKK
ncbi:MAG: phosphoglycerate kinase [Flavobacteriaceae bacterium]|nr:MAG: phosphoglycerate kinase [Flavobacteriaceae bacterium]